jgi:hypothetical protein
MQIERAMVQKKARIHKKRIPKYTNQIMIQRTIKLAKKYEIYRCQELKNRLRTPASLRTVQRICEKAKIHRRCPTTKASLSDEHIAKRMEFAKTHLEKPIKRKRIIFDDEADFTIRTPATDRKTLMCWGQKCKQKKFPDYHPKVSVLVAIGYNFKSKLICFRSKVNGDFYSSIVQDNLIKRLEEENL